MDLPSTEADRIVRQICDEAIAKKIGYRADPSASPRWQALRTEPIELQIAVALAANAFRPSDYPSDATAWQVGDALSAIVGQSFRRNLPFTVPHLRVFLETWLRQRIPLNHGAPGRAMIGAVERLSAGKTVPEELRPVLQAVRGRLVKDTMLIPTKFTVEVVERIDRLLDAVSFGGKTLPAGVLADELSRWIGTLPKEQGAAWLTLIFHSAEAGDKSKPSDKWLETACQAVGMIGPVEVVHCLTRLMGEVTPDPMRPDHSHDILKGLIWAASVLGDAAPAGEIGRFAEKCFQKIPDIGARSVKLGNAGLWSLSAMAGQPHAAAELFRLGEMIKYPSARKLIGARLGELAQRTGATVEEMEDFSLPSFGLDRDARLTLSLGGARVELAVTATETVQQWFSAAGKAVKNAPAEARASSAFPDYRRKAKDLDSARQSQVLRLEQSWLEERSWAFPDWEKHFLGHPLRRPIVASLIWRIDNVAVMPEAGALRDATGRPCTFGPDARVRLWHPLDAHPAEVLVWRARIVERGLTQPIKQAHREIYVLTDAERATRIYSNRFAAHILRQHQFRALCQARGWKYILMGQGWDGANIPTRALPKLGMSVEYQVEIVEEDSRAAPVALHVASDQVRFVDVLRNPVPLDRIPPIVFSEMLRDVDLFVSIASVANDPAWTDGGPEGQHGGYWREWAFGELGQSAATRKELLRWLVPRLSIADKLEITDRFLIVQGERQKYAIHFGSSNIQILPSNRYLCIVPDRAPRGAGNIKLPFAGDGLLSAILAKAFLLVDESKIKDETILRQL